MKTFHTTRRVEFNDTDMAGIMHFSRFFCFMEEAECDFWREMGISVVNNPPSLPSFKHPGQTDAGKDGRRVGFPRVGAQCDYIKPAFFEDVLDIQVTIGRLGTKSVTFACEFLKDGEVIARGQVASCCCLMGGSEGPIGLEIPPELRAKLEPWA